MRSDFKDYIRRDHLYQMNKQRTTLPDGVVTPLPVRREPFSSIPIHFAGPFPSDNKKELILVVWIASLGSPTSSQSPKTLQQSKTAHLLIERIFSVHGFPT